MYGFSRFNFKMDAIFSLITKLKIDGYLWALKDIASDQEIYNNTGIDVLQFKKKIIDVQDAATARVSKACPQFFGNIDPYLLKLAGDL